ncbi:MAG: GNAT family N-acetyltransferase, partial [Actinomycetia bacterium]|nr:GNAT family N-acetyltransferase [Actinomycetes bacterium]
MTDDCFGELVIETMAGRHIDAVKAVDELCYAAPWSKATWRREITEPSRCHLIARSGPTLIGHAGLLRVLDEAHITTVAVHPDRQGERIGTRLVLE